MKNKLLCLFMIASSLARADASKRPARIINVNSATNINYSLVQTNLYRDTSEAESKIQVVRAQLDSIGPNNQSSNILDVKLELPVPPYTMETYGATDVARRVGNLAGAVGGPKGAIAGTVISGIASLVDYGQLIAEQELNQLYETQDFRITLLEILPSRYYNINIQSNEVEMTDLFKSELKLYQSQMKKYLSALKKYRQQEIAYTQWYKKLVAFDPSGTKHKAQWETLRNYDKTTVQPLLAEKNRQEDIFAKLYPPYRISIMASPSSPGNTCGGFGAGPWELHINYYIGARQTNQMAIRYCVPDQKSAQTFVVELMQNSVQQVDAKNKQQKFIPGGIRIKAAGNASFARATRFQAGDYGANSTKTLNWFAEMVTNPSAGGIEHFSTPFDLFDLRERYAKQAQESKDAKMAKVLESMDQVVEQAKAAKGGWDKAQKDLKEAKGDLLEEGEDEEEEEEEE